MRWFVIAVVIGMAGCADLLGIEDPHLDDGPDGGVGNDGAVPRDTFSGTVNINYAQYSFVPLVGAAGDWAQIHVTISSPNPDLDWRLRGDPEGASFIIYEQMGVSVVDTRYDATTPTAERIVFEMTTPQMVPFSATVDIELYGNMRVGGG